MGKRWRLKEADAAESARMERFVGGSSAVARVLALRQFSDDAAVDCFLRPRLSELSDPFLLPDMEKAVERIWGAIEHEQVITVFGDYDVDGVTAGALMSRLLDELGANVESFIPDRLDEGYGLSQEALERCLEKHGSALVITVDCGVNAVESVDAAQRRGVDVIVTDHHEPGEETARPFALINPKLGSVEALNILAGVGVAFKLAHALVAEGRRRAIGAALQLDLKTYLDMAALGTVADIVPLVGENRVLVKYGLEQMAHSRWVGFRCLKEVAGVRGALDTYHLGFQLGPRINAAGRIGQPMEALRLLTSDDEEDAKGIADLLNRTNQERRELEKQMAEEAFAEIDTYFDPAHHFGLVVAREGWHPGVVGIVASRISRHYNRPAIVLGMDEDGVAKGSCRSIEAYDLLEGLQACEKYLLKFGGHKMAAGVTVRAGAFPAFKAAFNDAVGGALAETDLSPVQYVDALLEEEQVGWPLMEALKKLEPFGQCNPEPVWALCGVQPVGAPRVIGQHHLKFSLRAGGHVLDAIAFNYPLTALPEGAMDVAFVLKENEWNGQCNLQLQVKDIRPAGRMD